MDFSKDYFNSKGKNAEQLVHDLALKTFLTDWCYPNPMLPSGKELCDLLVVFDDTAIIWQIKDLRLGTDRKYKTSEIQKNLRQLIGARRQLFELNTPIEIENPRRGKELFNADEIKHIYLISVLLGEQQDSFSFTERIKNYTVHAFTRDFTEIILNELDTISDFTDYIRAKEVLLDKNQEIIIFGGEEELLAVYLGHNRSFEELYDATNVIIDQGAWEDFYNSQAYREKKEQDKISYGWDSIINKVHEASPEYEEVARELARPNRFERRVLSKAYLEAYTLAADDKKYPIFRRTFSQKGVTYCLLFFDNSRPRNCRKEMLKGMCFVARGIDQENKKVIGIATEKEASPTCSYDFVLFILPEWTDEDQKEMDRIQRETGIFLNPKISHTHEDEYPLAL